MTATLFDIQCASTVDGPGFRTTVFFKGCNLRCLWCHNPESQSFDRELLFYADRCIRCGACSRVCPNGLTKCEQCGRCAEICPQDARTLCGTAYTVEAVMKRICADRLFYEESGGGATFSGGECMLQLDFLAELARACRESDIHTAIDTAGDLPFASFERVLPYTDLFLYDLKCMDSDLHMACTGADNARILANLATLLRTGRRVWVRVPIVPGVNDSAQEMRRIRAFLVENGYPERVELLPYHRMGERKAAALGRTFTRYDVPDPARMDALRAAVAL